MELKKATADQKVKDAIGSLNEAVQILPAALDTIDRELDDQYSEKARIESASILLAEARREAAAEIEAVKRRVRERVVEVASGCNAPAQFSLLPSHHEMRDPSAVQDLFDLFIFGQAENLLKSIFDDAQIAKDWPDAIGKEDRAAGIAVLEKSIAEKEVAREELAVKLAAIKIFVDRRSTSPAEVILEFDGGKWNREKFSRLVIEFRGMQHQVGMMNEKINPLVKDLSEFERQLRVGDFRFAPQQEQKLKAGIKDLGAQIHDLRQKRESIEQRVSCLNGVMNRCLEFLNAKGIHAEGL